MLRGLLLYIKVALYDLSGYELRQVSVSVTFFFYTLYNSHGCSPTPPEAQHCTFCNISFVTTDRGVEIGEEIMKNGKHYKISWDFSSRTRPSRSV
jgi:hypothetical protein